MPDQPCNQVSRRSVRGPAGFVDGCEAAARLALCRGCAESWRAFHAGETIYRPSVQEADRWDIGAFLPVEKRADTWTKGFLPLRAPHDDPRWCAVRRPHSFACTS